MTGTIEGIPAFSSTGREDLARTVDWSVLVAEVEELDRIINDLDIGTGTDPPVITNRTTFEPEAGPAKSPRGGGPLDQSRVRDG